MYEDAYRVPFELERVPPLYRLLNISEEVVHGVALTLHRPGRLAANAPKKLLPGEALEVTIDGDDLERDAILVVRWFRASGVEYLWRASF